MHHPVKITVRLLIISLLTAQLSCKNTDSQTTHGTDATTTEQPTTFNTEEEVKTFITENMNRPIPDDYKVPSYITSGLPITQVFDTLKMRYPALYGKSGQEYLNAIMTDPDSYVKLSLESKAIRRQYGQ